MIRTGRMRHKIEVQQPASEQNDLGEDVPAWALVGYRWAEVRPLSGNELFRAKTVNAEVTHEVRLRWTDAVTPVNRLRYAGRTFEILSAVNVDERDAELLLTCKEHING